MYTKEMCVRKRRQSKKKVEKERRSLLEAIKEAVSVGEEHLDLKKLSIGQKLWVTRMVSLRIFSEERVSKCEEM